MNRLRSRLRIDQPAPDTLVLRSNPARRVLYGLIAALLLAAFFLGVDWTADFSGGSVVGTAFFAVLTLTCLGVAAYGRSIRFLREEPAVVSTRRLFGVKLGRDPGNPTRVKGLVLQGVRSFAAPNVRPRAGVLGAQLRSYAARRNSYFKLYLDLGDARQFLDDSSDRAELESVAVAVAGFLEVPFQFEEI